MVTTAVWPARQTPSAEVVFEKQKHPSTYLLKLLKLVKNFKKFHKMMILFNVLKFKHGSEMNLSYVEDLLETPPRFSSRWFLGQNLLVFYELSSLSDDEVMSGKRIVASISGL